MTKSKINWSFILFWLFALAFCFGWWYLVYLFVKKIAEGMGWS